MVDHVLPQIKADRTYRKCVCCFSATFHYCMLSLLFLRCRDSGRQGELYFGRRGLGRKAKYLTTQAKDDRLGFVHGDVGYKYRLTNVQAATGCAQMELLDEYIAAKRRITATYSEAFKDVPGITPMREAPWATSIFCVHSPGR
jgi:hypothetical protein